MTLDYHEKGILTKEEIIFIYHDFIDHASALKEQEVEIITGKGQVVKPIVLKEIKKDKRIKKYKFGDYWSGQDGVIVVELH